MPLKDLDYTRLSSELVRALRGRQSQSWLSQRAGYRSNIVHRWERGVCYPTAARFFDLCRRLKRDVGACLVAFFQHCPAWLDPSQPADSRTVAAFLSSLRGRTPILEIARAAGVNRYTLSRWLKGTAEPTLPDFLMMIDVCSRRLLDFIETLMDPSELPSVRAAWQRLVAARENAYQAPWSHAVLRALELTNLHRRDADSLAKKLGLPENEVAEALRLLHETGQVRRRRAEWVPARVQRVDTRRDPVRARGLTATWARAAIERLEHGVPGTFGYSLFAVSRHDLRRLQEVHLEYVRAMQSIIAQSRPNECVGLYCVQLLDLDPGPDNALREPV